VRDNQSLLDQAISHGDGKVTAATVKAMLGLGDRARTIDLFEQLMRGDIAAALTLMRELYDAGADPQTLIADLCDLTHLVTRIKVVPAAADDLSLTPDERTRGKELAAKLGMRVLSRTWQILFKGFDEVAAAGNALQAAEMVLVRLAYAADLPTPDELISKFGGERSASPSPAAVPVGRPIGGGGGAQALRVEAPRFEAAPQPAPGPTAMASPRSYADVIVLAGERRDLLLKNALESALRPLAFAEGSIEVALVEGANGENAVQMLQNRLKQWTGRNWLVSVRTTTELVPTVREIEKQQDEAVKAAAHEDPLVRAILETFPGARVSNVTVRESVAPDLPDLPPVTAYDEEDDDE
jgi:DNA polymerase-3 subunit gamma/tau